MVFNGQTFFHWSIERVLKPAHQIIDLIEKVFVLVVVPMLAIFPKRQNHSLYFFCCKCHFLPFVFLAEKNPASRDFQCQLLSDNSFNLELVRRSCCTCFSKASLYKISNSDRCGILNIFTLPMDYSGRTALVYLQAHKPGILLTHAPSALFQSSQTHHNARSA